MATHGHFSVNRENNAVMHSEFMAFINDENSVAILRNWAERQGYPAATVQLGGPALFTQMIETSPPPKIALIDIDGQGDPVGVTSRLIDVCGTDSKLVIVGSANDITLYRQLLGLGAVDYLVKPLSPEALNATRTAALQPTTIDKTRPHEAKIILVIGVRGGVGTSTIATNTGWFLSHEMKHNCALLDLDLQFGTTALSLDLEPGRGLRDIVSAPDRVDGLMIASSMVPESDHFSVLGGEEAIDEVIPVDSAAIMALLKEITPNFDFIIADLPRHMLAQQKRLLAAAHEILLVTELSLAGVRDTLRIKTALTALGANGKLTAVVSRLSSSHPSHIDQASFEKSAQIKINYIIPEDSKAMSEAANSGKALGVVARQSPLTQSLRDLAHKFDGKGKTAPPQSLNAALHKIIRSLFAKKAPIIQES